MPPKLNRANPRLSRIVGLPSRPCAFTLTLMSGTSNIIPFPSRTPQTYEPVTFHRRELGAILSVYGQLVAAGEWRDYAIDMTRDVAVFSVFRRMGEVPAYRIEKRPKNAGKQGAYSIIASDGRVLKRGSDLQMALRIFNRKLMKLAED